MEVLQVTRKGGKTNTFERFYIYNKTLLDNQIYNNCIVTSNAILVAVIQNYSGRSLSPL
jgi:hypothetical protein